MVSSDHSITSYHCYGMIRSHVIVVVPYSIIEVDDIVVKWILYLVGPSRRIFLCVFVVYMYVCVCVRACVCVCVCACVRVRAYVRV